MRKFLSVTEKISNLQMLAVAFIGSFLLYANTLKNEYALDDAIVITQNEFTKQGYAGIPKILTTDSFTGFFGTQKNLVSGGRYRPLSVVTFALEYEWYGLNPAFSHFWNIILYAGIVFLVFLVVFRLLEPKWKMQARTFAFFAALLFLLHPLHSEVVANIKGRDELFSLLFSLTAFLFALNYWAKNKLFWIILSALTLFLALLSKENALAFVFIIPFSVFYFKQETLKKSAGLFFKLMIPALVFVVIRKMVLGDTALLAGAELMNNPFLDATVSEKYATIFYTWLLYAKLLFFPHPLTYDYYPYHITLVNFGNIWVWLSMILCLGLFILLIKGFKSRSTLTYGLTGFAASFVMVSNLFFPVGTFMNERFLFVPSLFWSLILAGLLIPVFQKDGFWKPKLIFSLLFVVYIVLFFPVKTIERNKNWENDLTLFTADVKTSAGSAKSNCSAGGKLWEHAKTLTDPNQQKELYQRSEFYLNEAVKIHPTYADAWLLLGNVRFDYQRRIEPAAQCYLKVLQWQPKNETALKNFDIVLQQSTNRTEQLSLYEQANKLTPNRYILNYRMGVLYGRYFNQLDKSILYLEKATQIDPTKAEAFKDLGTALGISGNIRKAYEMFIKSIQIDPQDKETYNNLIISCMQLGLTNEANTYRAKMAELNP